MVCFRGFMLKCWLCFLQWCLPLTWQGTETSLAKWLGGGRSCFSVTLRMGFPVTDIIILFLPAPLFKKRGGAKQKSCIAFLLFTFLIFYGFHAVVYFCWQMWKQNYQRIQAKVSEQKACAEEVGLSPAAFILKHMHEIAVHVRKVLRSRKRSWKTD